MNKPSGQVGQLGTYKEIKSVFSY